MPMTQASCHLRTFNSLPGIGAGFLTRVQGVEVDVDREATCRRLESAHRLAVERMGFSWNHLHRAEQVHWIEIAIVGKNDQARMWSEVDGLVTAVHGVLVGIYVAD